MRVGTKVPISLPYPTRMQLYTNPTPKGVGRACIVLDWKMLYKMEDIIIIIIKGVLNKIHGMLEVQEPPLSHARKRLSLGSRRIYALDDIVQGVHLILKTMVTGWDHEQPVYYVNNFINWDKYNRHYNPDFEKDSKKLVDRWERELRQLME